MGSTYSFPLSPLLSPSLRFKRLISSFPSFFPSPHLVFLADPPCPPSEHILNTPKTAIADSLSGLCYLNPHTELYDTTLILRKPSKDKVLLVCGGGGGHEPAHACFVGDGMLSAAVSGQVFASPNAGQVEKALDKLKGGKGTLAIVSRGFEPERLEKRTHFISDPYSQTKNYTGKLEF